MPLVNGDLFAIGPAALLVGRLIGVLRVAAGAAGAGERAEDSDLPPFVVVALNGVVLTPIGLCE